MTRVGNTDQILLLLREQLRHAARDRTATRAERASAGAASSARPLERMRALAALASIDEREFRRAVVHGLLAEELGEAAANDPALIRIVDEVNRMIGESPEGRELMDRAVAQLKGSGA